MQIELNNYRIRSNHGTSDEWNNKPGFIPLEGEIILYTDLRRFKVGDGRTVVGALDFYTGDTAGEIRFSASADGANMTTTWSEGQAYIGFLNDATAPNDPASYIWCQFITSYTPSGWTVDQISKLEQIFNSLVYTNTSTQAVADALIASLRSGSGGDTPVITWTLTALEVLPTSITVPAGTTADNIKTYLTSMTGTYQSSDGQTKTQDLTSKISEVTISGTMPSAGSTATMTIAYGGKNAEVSVTTEAAAPTLTGLTATYTGGAVAAGTTLDQLNEVVKATYSDGTTSAALTKGTDYTLSGTLTSGQTNTVTVTGTGTYAGHTTTFSVTVAAAPPTLTGLTATYTGGTVTAGTTLAQLTEVVKATYSDGTTSAALTKGTDYTLSGTLTAGQANTITVTGKGTYAGFTTSFLVTVDAAITLSHLKVTYNNSTAVAAGTTLAQLNEVVRAVYSDNSESDVLVENTDYTLSGTLTPGQTNTVTVTGKGAYAGLAAVTFEVTVQAAVTTKYPVVYNVYMTRGNENIPLYDLSDTSKTPVELSAGNTSSITLTPSLNWLVEKMPNEYTFTKRDKIDPAYTFVTHAPISVNNNGVYTDKAGTSTNSVDITPTGSVTISSVPFIWIWGCAGMWASLDNTVTNENIYAPVNQQGNNHISSWTGSCTNLMPIKSGRTYKFNMTLPSKKTRIVFFKWNGTNYVSVGLWKSANMTSGEVSVNCDNLASTPSGLTLVGSVTDATAFALSVSGMGHSANVDDSLKKCYATIVQR